MRTRNPVILFLRHIWRFLSKVMYWVPVLWADEDWDYVHLLNLLQKKIVRMADHMEHHNIIENSEQYTVQMREVVDLISKFIEDDFLPELDEAHNAKWGKMTMEYEPFEGRDDLVRTKFVFKDKNYTAEELEQERVERFDKYNKQEKARQDCWDAIFDKIKQNGQYWWD